MVALSLSFLGIDQLHSYQIQGVSYNLYNDRAQFILVDYFADLPSILVTIKYFEVNNNIECSIRSHILPGVGGKEYKMTLDVEKTVKFLVKNAADNLRGELKNEIDNTKNDRECKRWPITNSL